MHVYNHSSVLLLDSTWSQCGCMSTKVQGVCILGECVKNSCVRGECVKNSCVQGECVCMRIMYKEYVLGMYKYARSYTVHALSLYTLHIVLVLIVCTHLVHLYTRHFPCTITNLVHTSGILTHPPCTHSPGMHTP